MLKICLVFWESEPRYAYGYAYKKNMYIYCCMFARDSLKLAMMGIFSTK